MRGARTAVIIIHSKGHRVEWYRSISEASRVTGISKWRLLRGLEDPDGLIPRTKPAICIDEALFDNEELAR